MKDKLIEVDEVKWKKFKLWCMHNDILMRERIDTFLNGEYKNGPK